MRTACILALMAAVAGLATADIRRGEDGKFYSDSIKVQIPYEVSDSGPAKLQRVELWLRRNGAEWKMATTDNDKKSPVTYIVPGDGRYEFTVVAYDEAGQTHATPAPEDVGQISIIVDSTPPSLEMMAPREGDIFAPGRTVPVRWKVEDDNIGPHGIMIEYSTDGGRHWVAASAGEENDGKADISVPVASRDGILLRLSATDLAGHRAVARLVRGFSIKDGVPLRSTHDGPIVIPGSYVKSRGLTVDVEYELEDPGPAGLEKVQLWYTPDGGKTWRPYGFDVDNISPVVFRSPGEGAYGFYVVAYDAAGNHSEMPIPGTEPFKYVVIDTTPPRVMIESPVGGERLPGGTVRTIKWSAVDANMAEKPITIELSSDGGESWEPLAVEEENDGGFAWQVPMIDGGTFRIRVTAVDLVENAGFASSSENFSIDSGAPQIRVAGTETWDDSRPAERIRRVSIGHYSKATLLRQRGRQEEALKEYDQAITLWRGNRRARADKAALLAEMGRLEDAFNAYREALGRDARDPVLHYGMGLTLRALSDLEQSAYHLEQAVVGTRDDALRERALWYLSEVYEEIGDYHRAAHTLKTLVATVGPESSWHQRAGERIEDLLRKAKAQPEKKDPPALPAAA